MKVSRPAEDICGYCYTFAKRHQILSSHQSAMLQQQQETTDGNDDDERDLIAILNSVSLNTPGSAYRN
jgi:hypothetical protein